MAINDRIKEARNKSGYTQEELGKLIGVAKSTVAGYERGSSEPSMDVLIKIMSVLEIDANYLWQDYYNEKEDFSADDLNFMRTYKSLDQQGQETVQYILDNEKKRCAQIIELSSKVEKLDSKLNRELIPKRIWAYYGKIAAAGMSFGFDDITAGTIETPVTDENKNADYTIGVSGNSMEPTFSDGDIVYVQKTTRLNVGDIGIFQKDNGIYIKEVGENELISHNKKYDPLTNNGDIRCLGKVLGKI